MSYAPDYEQKVFYGYEVDYDDVQNLPPDILNALQERNWIKRFNYFNEPYWVIIGFTIYSMNTGNYSTFDRTIDLLNEPRYQHSAEKLEDIMRIAFPKYQRNAKPRFFYGCEVS